MTTQRKRRIFRRALAFLAAAIVLAVALDLRTRPLLREYAVNRAAVLVSDAMSAAVNDTLATGDYAYDRLMAVQRDASGAVQSVEADPAAVNRLSAAVTASLNRVVAEDDFATLKIPLANATGSAFLAGRGPKVTLRVQQNGAASATLTGSFVGAGINQTVHRLELTVTFRAVVLVAGMSEPLEHTSTFLVAETVIVGTVPEAYAHLIRNSA